MTPASNTPKCLYAVVMPDGVRVRITSEWAISQLKVAPTAEIGRYGTLEAREVGPFGREVLVAPKYITRWWWE